MSSNRRNYEREEDRLSYRSQRVEKEGLPRTTYRDTRERERERGGRQREGGRFQREKSPERQNDRYARTRDFHRSHNRDWDRGGERRLERERERERVPDGDRMYRRERYDRYDRYDRVDRRREDVEERFRGGDRRGERERERVREQGQKQDLGREKEKDLDKRNGERRDFKFSDSGEERMQAEMIARRKGQQKEKPTDETIEGMGAMSSGNGNGKEQNLKKEEGGRGEEEEEEVIVQEELNPMEDMQSMMGFSGFGTTTGKKHGDVGDVFKQKKAKYRQYMNRPGGFNRPLERD
ncbi:U4/U6 X U5 tri-snRNP complex subunit [Schizosaccharomyces octosporus yFS286]|uniref:U4/U6 X U5 tri-snRNP complex subunit n=1 Tax=Schizosaccharomyces octosporus (strain yFS286) TaxID=483514 RepID=S9Q0I3_SCHOY|nr:U4/U6 X U5 tri-snRNP complex subunit [Schizosaccharomyces octosporus yFS286]EPX73707.1 U4/U6 X U5 tri-snRNP complex subunit [Schizosaccharomyces octosporus yFS286]